MHFGKQIKLLALALLKKALKDLVEDLVRKGQFTMVARSRRQSIDSARRRSMSLTSAPVIQPKRKQSTADSSKPDDTKSLLSALPPDDDTAEGTLSGVVELSSLSVPRRSIDGAEPSMTSTASTFESEAAETESERKVMLEPGDAEKFLGPMRAERVKVAEFFVAEFKRCVDEFWACRRLADEHKFTGYSVAPLKARFLGVVLDCEELLDFSRLNLVGFNKILKKFCRHTDFADKESVSKEIQASEFVTQARAVEELRDKAKSEFATLFSSKPGVYDPKLAQELDESVKAERSWKNSTILFEVQEHMQKATIHTAKGKVKPIPVVVAAVVFLVLMFAPILDSDSMPAQRCLAILSAATILWVTECWPLFVTALLVALLTALSFVLLDAKGNPLDPSAAVKEVFRRLFPSSVPLVLAGFSIAEAFKKYKIDKAIAQWLLGLRVFQTPGRFVIAVELLCFVMSMFVSNVAASVLTLTVIMPIIRDLPDHCRYIKTLLMATAVAGNVGGMTTQIASPQNAVSVSLGEHSIDFLRFSVVALPVCPLLLITGHILVMLIFRPDVDRLPELSEAHKAAMIAEASSSGAAAVTLDQARESRMKGHPDNSKKDTRIKVIMVVFIFGFSVALWVASNWLTPFGKSIGAISFIPIVAFYGTGLLGKDDFERMPWPVVMLLAGGSVLGYAVESSRLLELAAGLLEELPANVIVLSAVSCLVMMIAGSFISHTVAALILLSLSAKIGETVGHPKLMVMTSIIMDSGAMPLPVSSFPNLNAISLEDASGTPYLSTIDFLKVGIPQTLFGLIGACTVTYGMSLLVGF